MEKAFGCHNDRAEAVGMHSNYSYQAFLNFTLEALALLEKPVDLVKQTIVSTENKPAETGSGDSILNRAKENALKNAVANCSGKKYKSSMKDGGVLIEKRQPAEPDSFVGITDIKLVLY